VTLPPAPDAILTRDEVCAWLKCAPRQVDRWDIPAIYLGPKSKRWLAKDVLDWLVQHRKNGSQT
jgi:hypothetical protein